MQKKIYKRTRFNFSSDVSKFILENENIYFSDPRNYVFNSATNSRIIPNKWMKILDKNNIKGSLRKIS